MYSKKKSKKAPGNRKIWKATVPAILLAIIFTGIVVGMSYFRKSLFTVMTVPDFQLMDQNGKMISNKDMLGKVYLVEFFYSTCPTICPVMNNNMKFVDREINSPDFGIISVSIDPKRDTPEVLKKHADALGVKNPNWHFLTGDRDYIGKIADEFNIYVGDKEDESESLNHSGMIALVDKYGKIRCRYGTNHTPILYYSGLNYKDAEGKTPQLNGPYHPERQWLVEDIRKLLDE